MEDLTLSARARAVLLAAVGGSVVAGLCLVALTPRMPGRCLLYAMSLWLFLAATLAAGVPRRPAAANLVRRLEHGALFALMATTGTLFASVLLPDERPHYLGVLWIGSAMGLVAAVVWPQAPRWAVGALALAVCSGLSPFLLDLFLAIGPQTSGWLVAGVLTFTLGTVAASAPWPRPGPHRRLTSSDVYATLTVLGGVDHFIAVVRLVW